MVVIVVTTTKIPSSDLECKGDYDVLEFMKIMSTTASVSWTRDTTTPTISWVQRDDDFDVDFLGPRT